MRSIKSLVPYAENARTHSEKQVKQIAASMKEWGWTNPVLIDEDGTIIAGHGRVLAGLQLEYETAPVMIARGWTEKQKKAYVIADNQLAANAGWDMSKLRTELSDLKIGFDVNLLGFTEATLAKMFDDGERKVEMKSVYEVVIACKDETEQLKVLKQITDLGIECRALIA